MSDACWFTRGQSTETRNPHFGADAPSSTAVIHIRYLVQAPTLGPFPFQFAQITIRLDIYPNGVHRLTDLQIHRLNLPLVQLYVDTNPAPTGGG